MRLPTRPGLTARRRPRVLRASARKRLGRILAGVGLVAAIVVLYVLTTPERFTIRPDAVDVRGAHHTDVSLVHRALGLREGRMPNVFRLRTVDLASSLRSLPTVVDADVRVALPDRLVVELRERQAILAWQAGARRFLVDVEGLLFAEAPDQLPRGLPLIVDRRSASSDPQVGDRLDPVELNVVRRLGAVTPKLLGSRARRLDISLADEGFALEARPNLWRALFGHYTRELRPPELIDEQVQCLRALVAGRERALATVWLAPEGDRCGTFVAREGRP